VRVVASALVAILLVAIVLVIGLVI
jgi:hypothetical protein